jgi:hypothetical protein
VRWNGRVYEAMAARREHRRPENLYHAALEVVDATGLVIVEMTPAWGRVHSRTGTVASGPVGWGFLGRTRFFRYEVHCWRDGVIPDRDSAVGGPHRLTSDVSIAARVLELTPSFPTAVWGRDEFRTGDMWNSNSLVAWLLARAEIPLSGVKPPDNGRAPGWTAGLVVASSQLS